MTPPQEILDLVEHFERNEADFRSNRYNETELRREFLDPFFEALGWDVNNRHRYSETYKDVVHEPTRETDEGTPDYCFRVGGTPKFYLEAKKPAVRLKDNADPALQLRRYGWSSKLPLSVLSSFDELAIYDCRIAPKQGDKASTARISYYTYRDYPDKWEEIYARFSKEAVLQGSFDRFVVSAKAKKGTTEVDKAFLVEIETWRHDLAASMAVRNPKLTQREVNFAVQRTIDRIIFLRICEDRGLEGYGQLRKLTEHSGIYPQLCELFRKADERYNSGLFHFQKEKDREENPDTITPTLKVDDARLKPILKRLYYPESPYAFSHVPADILGQVYEQFLGQVIRITPARQVKIEPKPEVRKAGGVYYTPTYIVDYIVKSTVGKLLDGKSPKQVANIRVLDPACGSGSFLIGAYQYLMNWYRDAYVNDGPQKHQNEIVRDQVGNWRLTLNEKKKILVRHIYGVDIDSQAVEVTKLSLLLKVLEGESQLKLFHERALPDLGKNIKCGNSLISTDYFKTRQMQLIDEETIYRINAFDWHGKDGFNSIMNAGGFDVVIGNPPYLYSAAKEDNEYFDLRYQYAQYQTDFYVYFMEKALGLARKNGLVSFIVSDSWLNSERISRIRNFILGQQIQELAVFDYPVFKKVTLENSIFVVKNADSPCDFPIIRFASPESYASCNIISPAAAIERNLIDPRGSAGVGRIIKLIEKGSFPLATLLRTNRGLHAYRTDGYGESAFVHGHQTNRDKEERSYHADKKLDDTYLPEVKGKQVGRYEMTPSGRFIKYGPWLAEPREPDFFYKRKIVLRKILGRTLSGTLLNGEVAVDQSLYIGLARDGRAETLKHVLGVMLSGIGAWYLRNKYSIFDSLYPWYTKKQLDAFPMKPVDTQLVGLVDSLIKIKGEYGKARTDQERIVVERQIEATDRQIDKLVYELYGLTDSEIEIVESSTTVG
ncbi:MAG: DNA methyltransferase [Terracidiphilus sp.]|jgi:type I restriction-modification system DNA methylase subunit